MKLSKFFYNCFIVISLSILSFSLVGCSNSKNKEEVEKYIAQVESRPAPKVTPIPEFQAPARATYAANNLRSPFQPNITRRPDENRQKEPLEAYPLDSLKMVGTLWQDNKLWAIVATPTNMVYKVTVGTHLGQNYGRVVTVSTSKINIEETVPDGAGWRMQPVVLAMHGAQEMINN